MTAVVVTGVSTGIGKATVKVLLSHGIEVYGSVRRQDDARRLLQEFGTGFVPLVFDITNQADVKRAADFVRKQLRGNTLSGLVNNAGIAVPGALLDIPIENFRNQLEVNIVGQLIVTQAFLPLLGVDKTLNGPPGKIITISSVAGKRGLPFLGAYAASKHGIEGLSESLRRELMLYGIDVIIIGPGSIKTAIWDKAEEVAIPGGDSDYTEPMRRFKDMMIANGKAGMPAEKVAELVWKILQTKSPKTRYTVMQNKLANQIMSALMPKRLLDRIIAKKLGLVKKNLL